MLSMPQFHSYVGIDYSGASARTQNLEGLRVYRATADISP
jgi:hypothetical protein